METGKEQVTQQVREKEIPLKNGEIIKLPTLYVTKLTLYHGSSITGITRFEEGDQQTIGKGIYFTPNIKAAREYAAKRSNGNDQRIYKSEVKNMDIADLRTKSSQEEFAKLFKEALLDWEQDTLPSLRGPSKELTNIVKQQCKDAIKGLLSKIDSNSFQQLRDLTFGWADLVSSTLQKEGYKGLMAIEGEPPTIDFHDSIVIFNPADLANIQEKAA